MTRQKEAGDIDSVEEQLLEKRQTRIDAVRRQGERDLRKVNLFFIYSIKLNYFSFSFSIFKNRYVSKY